MIRKIIIAAVMVSCGNFLHAQTSGPTTPDVQSFTPTGADNMVNLFTGDFQYSIPLMDVGGYPINISYSSGASMNEEASMVGLGWNFNPGVINRTVKGLPDDFNGDEIIKTSKIRPSKTLSLATTLSAEFTDKNFGVGMGLKFATTYNNYRGIDVSVALSPSVKIGSHLNAGLTIESGTQGASMSPNLNVKTFNKSNSAYFGVGLSTSFGSLEGFQGLTVSPSVSARQTNMKKETTFESASKRGLGTNFSFGTAKRPFLPSIGNGSKNKNYWLSFQGGPTFLALHCSIEGRGAYSIQEQKNNSIDIKKAGFGYLYLQNHYGESLFDKSNEKVKSINTIDKNLYLTYLEPDIFSVSAEGFSGSFRPFRIDVGSANDCAGLNEDITAGISVDGHAGNIFQGGVDVSFSGGKDSNEKWDISSPAFNFSESSVYFKNTGEMNVMNSRGLFDKTGGFGPSKLDVFSEQNLIPNQGIPQAINVAGALLKNKENTNTQFTYLTAGEASVGGIYKNINDYYFSDDQQYANTPVTRAEALFGVPKVDANGYKYKLISRGRYSSDHISEIIVTAENGTRYVFSVPAYNIMQEEYSFDVSASQADVGNLVHYSNIDKTVLNNADTKTKMFTCTKTPAYTYAHYLSAILSQDYVDVTGDGPTSDDYGTYTRFNYSRVYEDFQWKNPIDDHKASFNEGYLSDDRDQSASFTCGKKEIWYLHSIESRNMLARFKYTRREDVKENKVDNESSFNPRQLYKLEEIKLYSKSDFIAHQNVNERVPIKTVKLNYEASNNSLCKRDMGNGIVAGKLTLKSVEFTYSKSQKEKLSGYKFSYGTSPNHTDVNSPNYAIDKVDRWGVYNSVGGALGMNNSRAPYTPQDDKVRSDRDVAAWQLSTIETPNGGQIDVEYEADDYAYVQDKKAMQMYNIVGFGKDKDSYSSNADRNRLYDYWNMVNQYNNFMFVDLGPFDSSIYGNEDYLRKLIEDKNKENLTNPYYDRIFTNVQVDDNPIAGVPYKENIQTFSTLKSSYVYETDFGWFNANNGRLIAYFNIGNGNSRIGNINPITFDTWQKIMHERRDLILPPLVSNLPDDGIAGIRDVAFGIVNTVKNLIDIFLDFETKMTKSHKIGHKVDLSQSFVRLNNVSGYKIGGGARVKKITVSDNWYSMTNQTMQTKKYGNAYFYTTEEDGRTISSGVASYEPVIGGDESPFFDLDFEIPIGPRNNLSKPLSRGFKPYGEMRLPAPGVGYSKVRVEPINGLDEEELADLKTHRAGYTVSEFYTAKDYPTILDRTTLSIVQPGNTLPRSIVPFTAITNLFSTSYEAAQGFYIELNDMHGKQKANFVYSNEDNQPISGTKYYYKTSSFDSKRLDNIAKSIDINTSGQLKVENKIIGVDFDYFAELIKTETSSFNPSVGINVDLGTITPLVIAFGDFRFNLNNSIHKLKLALTNKVVYRSGILDKVETFDNGAKTEARNIAFDAKTGSVLITETQNEFLEPYYTTTIPAHFVNKEMNFASINEGKKGLLNSVRIGVNGPLNYINNISGILLDELNGGEELVIRGLSHAAGMGILGERFSKAWVYKEKQQDGTNKFYLINPGGGEINGNQKYKIIRSGFHNMQTTPVMNVITKTNPIIVHQNGTAELKFEKVIDASATKYSNVWQSYKAFKPNLPESLCHCDSVENDPMLGIHMNGNINFSSQPIAIPENNLCEQLGYDCSNLPSEVRSPSFEISGNQIIITMHDNPQRAYDEHKNDCTLRFQFNEVLRDVASIHIRSIQAPALPDEYDNSEGATIAQGCDNVNQWTGEMRVRFLDNCGNDSVARTLPFVLESDCANSITCFLNQTGDGNPVCDVTPDGQEIVNPYVMGLRGVWRPSSTYKFITQRLYASLNSQPSALKDKGTYAAFYSFYNNAFLQPNNYNVDNSDIEAFWQRADINLITESYGRSLETIDALNRPSAQVYGYNHQLPIATAVNAHYYDIAFDGFEDYTYSMQSASVTGNNCPIFPHSHFYTSSSPDLNVYTQEGGTDENNGSAMPEVCLVNYQSHTGKHALRIKNSSSVYTSSLEGLCDIPSESDAQNLIEIPRYNQVANGPTGKYVLNTCDLVRPFSANTPGKKYKLSAWVKETTDIDDLSTSRASIKVRISDNGQEHVSTFVPSGKIIDGWRQVSGTFDLPNSSNMTEISVELNSADPQNPIFFDDIRIFPDHSTMKTHVFDPITLRMMAELDEQNFATFYEYDDEGQLTRTKKETERGIVTIQEVRNAKPKKY